MWSSSSANGIGRSIPFKTLLMSAASRAARAAAVGAPAEAVSDNPTLRFTTSWYCSGTPLSFSMTETTMATSVGLAISSATPSIPQKLGPLTMTGDSSSSSMSPNTPYRNTRKFGMAGSGKPSTGGRRFATVTSTYTSSESEASLDSFRHLTL